MLSPTSIKIGWLYEVMESYAKHRGITDVPSLPPFFILALVLSMFCPFSNAQQPTQDAANRAEQLIRDRAAQERQREIELKKQRNQPPPSTATPSPALDQPAPDEQCVTISTITIKGVSLLDSQEVKDIILAYQGRCLGVSDLNNILKRLTHTYADKGYVTSRALLPEQDLSSGALEIIVVEGYLEKIIIDGEESKHQSKIDSAFPHLINKPLNLRDVEQGLDQINRLSSHNATIELKPGEAPNSTTLLVTTNKSNEVYGSISNDNLGSQSTGIYQYRLALSFDDIYGHNDAWGLSYQRSTAVRPFRFSSIPQSELISINSSFVYGYWGFNFDASWSEYTSQLPNLTPQVTTSGASQTLNFAASLTTHRDQTSITKLSAKLSTKRNRNFIARTRINTSSRNLSIATLELLNTTQLTNGQFITFLNYHQGLSILGALSDEDTPDDSPRAQYESISFFFNAATFFQAGQATGSFKWQFTGQYSKNLLFGSEQVAYGSNATVRGLRETVLFGNNGILLRHELSFSAPQSSDPDTARGFGRFETYFTLDYGKVFEQIEYQLQGGELVGAGIGIRTRGGIVNLDISHAQIVNYSSHLFSAQDQKDITYATLSFSF